MLIRLKKKKKKKKEKPYQRGLQYDDCFLCWEMRPPPSNKKTGVQSMILNCIWFLRSSSGALGSEEYLINDISFSSTQTQSGSTC